MSAMKIGTFTYGYQRNPLEHAFEDAKRFGYDYVELWGGRPHAFAYDLKAGDIKNVQQLINKYDMPVLGYTPEHNAYPYNFMIGSEAMWQDAVDYLKLCLDMGREMGANFVLIGPAHAGYETPRSEIKARLKRTLAVLVSHAEKVKVPIVLESLTTFESNTCTTADDLAEMMEHFDSEYLVGMCDIVPPFVAQESIMSYFTKLGDKMRHLHIIDSDAHTKAHLVPGEGVLPMKEFLHELKAIGYNHTATLELVSAYVNEPRFYAKLAIDNFKELYR